GYTDVRDLDNAKLEESLKKIVAGRKAANYRVVSLGDEIGLAAPAEGVDEAFRAWAQAQKLKASDVDPEAGEDWTKVKYNAKLENAKTNPRTYYYSRRYLHQYGINNLKTRTELIQKYLPNALP